MASISVNVVSIHRLWENYIEGVALAYPNGLTIMVTANMLVVNVLKYSHH